MEHVVKWNVFVPQQIWTETQGYLTGCVDHDNHLIYIGGIGKTIRDLKDLKPIGIWQGSGGKTSTLDKLGTENLWVSLYVDDMGKIHCSLHIRSISDPPEARTVVCVTFDPEEVMKSFILIKSSVDESNTKDVHGSGNADQYPLEAADCVAGRLRSKSSCGPSRNKDVPKSKVLGAGNEDCITVISQMLHKSPPYGAHLPAHMRSFYFTPRCCASQSVKTPLFLMWIWSCVENIVQTGFHHLKVCCSPFPRILHSPSIFQYMKDKSLRYRECFRMDKTVNLNLFLLYNCYGQQLLDSCLGVTIIALVTNLGLHQLAAMFVMDWADQVASQLSDLVEWLMGAPAGLKLNAQLTNFLGHFFIYHIYLWTGYLSLLRTVMPSLLWYCSLIGVVGVSAQLCLLRDLLSMLTLHIYCFYVYAAKIFSLQVYVIGSLWRLFRGKKWNVLRSRVDSAAYSTDQLFVGTLFFTVLLFLLPTTALYYTVFTLLRLAVLTVQGCAAFILDLIMMTPVYTLTVRLLRPKLVAGNVKFTVKHALQEENCLVVHMETCHMPLVDLVKLTNSFLQPSATQSHTWLELLSHLATGKLIYPWVEPHQLAAPQWKTE